MAIDRAPAPPSATLPDDLSLAGWFDLLERADALPHRRRYLMLAMEHLRGLLALHLQLVERVEAELEADPA